MLDQNTDRMWYVIGAVLIGAAIIFGMNTLMPETFASVGENMESVLSSIRFTTKDKFFWQGVDITTIDGVAVEYGGAMHYGHNRDDLKELNDYQLDPYYFRFHGSSRPDAAVQFKNPFNKSGVEYKVTIDAERLGHAKVPYHVFYGDDFIGEMVLGDRLSTYTFTGLSPDNLDEDNHIMIKSAYDGAMNSMWLWRMDVELVM